MAAHPVYRILVSVVVLLNLSSVAGCSASTSLPLPTATAARTATAIPLTTLSELPTNAPTTPPTKTRTAIPAKTLAPTKTPDLIEMSTRTRSSTATITPAPTLDLYGPSVVSMFTECRAVVDNMYELKKDLGFMYPPDHFLADIPYRQGSDFNPNRYFNVLTHIKLAEGYKLDYIYSANEMGGRPLLYARRSNTEPFQSYDEFLASFGEGEADVGSFITENHRYDYLSQIRLAKTPESYFDLIALAFLGDQFYLYWHGLYNDEQILCDPSDLKYVHADMQYFRDDGIELRPVELDKIEDIDFKPVVILGEDTVTVRFVSFTKWGGFYENVYLMEKDNPLQVLDVQHNPLVEYDCGMRF